MGGIIDCFKCFLMNYVKSDGSKTDIDYSDYQDCS